MSPSRPRPMVSRPSVRAVLVAVLAAAATAGSAGGGFVFDDPSAIVDNGVVTGRYPWRSVFTHDFWGRLDGSTRLFRPLATLSFRADWRLGGGSPLPFHLVNILAHAAVCAAAYLVWRTIASEAAALGGAALFAVLAAPSEAVDAIMGRSDILLALCCLLGLLAHARGRFALAASALFLATCCKESAVFAPLAWFLIELPRSGRVRAVLAYGGALAAAGAMRFAALGALSAPHVDLMRNPLRAAMPVERLLGAARVFARFYLPGLLDPRRRLYTCGSLACGPSGASDLLAWAGLAALVALVAAPFLLWRRSPDAARGVAWFLVFFLPVSNVFVVSSTVYAERLLYVPCLGLCLAVASGLLAVRPRAAGVTALALLAGCNAASLQSRHRDWHSSTELYLSALPIAPDSAQIQSNAAVAWYRLHDAHRAEEHARVALRLWPGDARTEVVLALALDRLGRPEEAEPLFARAFQASSFDVDVAADYARFLLRHRRGREAESVLRRAKAAWPDSAALDPLLRHFP